MKVNSINVPLNKNIGSYDNTGRQLTLLEIHQAFAAKVAAHLGQKIAVTGFGYGLDGISSESARSIAQALDSIPQQIERFSADTLDALTTDLEDYCEQITNKGCACLPMLQTGVVSEKLGEVIVQMKGGCDSGNQRGPQHSITRDKYAMKIAKEVYKEKTCYHGTSKTSKASLQANGFKMSQKSNGAICAALPGPVQNYANLEMVKNAEKHHYFTIDKPTAEFYANLTGSKNGALTRFMVNYTSPEFEPDPDSGPNDKDFRTPWDISREHVLTSKGGDYSNCPEAVEIYRQGLWDKGLRADREETIALLASVQSDSDDDEVAISKARDMRRRG